MFNTRQYYKPFLNYNSSEKLEKTYRHYRHSLICVSKARSAPSNWAQLVPTLAVKCWTWLEMSVIIKRTSLVQKGDNCT